jgi:hypothetical protein
MSTSSCAQLSGLPLMARLTHIAAAIDSLPACNDAAVLAIAITRAMGGDLLLVSIEPELPLVVPGADWRRMRRAITAMLTKTRDSFAPGAREAVDSDLSSARGIKRVLGQQHRELISMTRARP